ncbi:hypothetical protein Y032_0080g1355 [Ancylostoma ceylanicum]|nr:hypothetical protein Y032_0080g1355 [Ancylostoma ceylanicum]
MVFAVVLLSIPAVLLACSTLPPGQEARVGFLVQDLFSVPIQFATSADQSQWATKFPDFAPSATEATKNVQKAVKKALMQVIREEARRAGVEHLAGDIANQIKPTVRYTPMNCGKFDNVGAGGAVNPPDFECNANTGKNAITTVKINNNDVEIPANYREFTVNLLDVRRKMDKIFLEPCNWKYWENHLITSVIWVKREEKPSKTGNDHLDAFVEISNYIIGGWGRERWQFTLMKVERLLRKDKTYGPSFKTATIELLYP